VIAAQDHRDRARRRHREHGVFQPLQRLLGLARRHEHIAGVGHAQLGQRVHAQREVRPRGVVRQVVGDPDRLRAEPGSRPVRGAAVERRAQEHHVVPVERVEFRPGHPEEGDVGPVHPARDGLVVLSATRHDVPS